MLNPPVLTAAAFLGDNCRHAHREVAAHVARALGAELDFRSDARLADLAGGRIDLAFLCSLPYRLMARRTPAPVSLLAAPVLRDRESGGEATFSGRVVVRADAAPRTFAALRGARLAYNEEVSLSGYRMLEWHLRALGLGWDYFSERRRCGSHARALAAVLAGEADCASIDSQVLAAECVQRPGLAAQIRIVDSLGPHPVPPVVVRSALAPVVREQARAACLDVHRHCRAALAGAAIARFTVPAPGHYRRLDPLIDGLGVTPWFD